MDRVELVAKMRTAAADFRVLLDAATSAELRRGSDGTKWTNEQLLFALPWNCKAQVHAVLPSAACRWR